MEIESVTQIGDNVIVRPTPSGTEMHLGRTRANADGTPNLIHGGTMYLVICRSFDKRAEGINSLDEAYAICDREEWILKTGQSNRVQRKRGAKRAKRVEYPDGWVAPAAVIDRERARAEGTEVPSGADIVTVAPAAAPDLAPEIVAALEAQAQEREGDVRTVEGGTIPASVGKLSGKVGRKVSANPRKAANAMVTRRARTRQAVLQAAVEEQLAAVDAE